jgi:photosystem II stability/assembly factor-like uncharacterized protein
LNVLCMAISPGYVDDETLFVGTESGIFRSTNGGRAWREVDFSPDLAPVLSLAISPNYPVDTVLLAGTESHSLFYSQDGGNTWESLSAVAPGVTVNGILLSPEFPAKAHVLALLAEGLIVSWDGGHTWSKWGDDLPLEHGLTSVVAPYGLDPGVPLLIGLANGQVLRV